MYLQDKQQVNIFWSVKKRGSCDKVVLTLSTVSRYEIRKKGLSRDVQANVETAGGHLLPTQ